MGRKLKGFDGLAVTAKRKDSNIYAFLAQGTTSENVPSSSVGTSYNKVGDLVYDGNYIYYCFASFNGTDHIWKRVAWTDLSWEDYT